jgi:predicted nuclease with RNAse H fold
LISPGSSAGSGVAVLRSRRLERLHSVFMDQDVQVAAALVAGGGGVVAINAPLTLPLGRCCLDDDCRCRYDPGARSRGLERQLRRMGVPILATALIKIQQPRSYRRPNGRGDGVSTHAPDALAEVATVDRFMIAQDRA